MSNVVTYNAPPTIGAFMRSDKFLRGLMGPFGSGKSVGCLFEMLRRCLEQKPGKDGIRRSRWAIIRNTYPELRDTTRATFEDWMPGGKDPANWLEQEFSFTLRYKDVEAEFLFRALDRPEHVKKLLSLELTGAWINEAREVPFQVVKMLSGRVGRYPSMRDGGPTWDGIIMDTNPPDDDSWWYKLFEEDKPANAAIFKQPGGLDKFAENLGHWEDARGNCTGHYPWEQGGGTWVPHLKKGYYENLVTLNANDPLWVKVHVHAQYGPTMTGRPVYPEFRDNMHVVDPKLMPAIERVELLVGVDFGLTPAAVIGQRDPRDQQLQIIDELCAEDLGAVRFFEDLARYIRRTYPNRLIHGTGDPGGDIRSQVDERTPYDIASSQGIPLVPAHTNDFELRRDAVGRACTRLTIMGRPALVISSKCKVLRKAMNGGYAYKRISAPGEVRFRDVPDKNIFSHPAEALQYLALGEGEDSTALESAHGTRKVKQPFKVKTAGVRRRA
jgi:terminase large subunit-like protein